MSLRRLWRSAGPEGDFGQKLTQEQLDAYEKSPQELLLGGLRAKRLVVVTHDSRASFACAKPDRANETAIHYCTRTR